MLYYNLRELYKIKAFADEDTIFLPRKTFETDNGHWGTYRQSLPFCINKFHFSAIKDHIDVKYPYRYNEVMKLYDEFKELYPKYSVAYVLDIDLAIYTLGLMIGDIEFIKKCSKEKRELMVYLYARLSEILALPYFDCELTRDDIIE